jgi:hypothetical protein
MQSSLLVEPADRNIKAADIADSAEIAKIVEIAALRMDARQHPRQKIRARPEPLAVRDLRSFGRLSRVDV